jgi:hypothetical protein
MSDFQSIEGSSTAAERAGAFVTSSDSLETALFKVNTYRANKLAQENLILPTRLGWDRARIFRSIVMVLIGSGLIFMFYQLGH